MTTFLVLNLVATCVFCAWKSWDDAAANDQKQGAWLIALAMFFLWPALLVACIYAAVIDGKLKIGGDS